MKRRFVGLTLSMLVLSLLLTLTTVAQDKVKVVIFVGLGTGTDPDQITQQEALSQCSKVCQQKSGSNKGLKPLVQHQHFRLMA